MPLVVRLVSSAPVWCRMKLRHCAVWIRDMTSGFRDNFGPDSSVDASCIFHLSFSSSSYHLPPQNANHKCCFCCSSRQGGEKNTLLFYINIIPRNVLVSLDNPQDLSTLELSNKELKSRGLHMHTSNPVVVSSWLDTRREKLSCLCDLCYVIP